MKKTLNAIALVEQQTGILSATVAGFTAEGRIFVNMDQEIQDGVMPRRVLCDYLQTTESDNVKLVAGDRVLVLMPSGPEQCGCVLGKLGTYQSPNKDKVLIKADKELTLECGDASITLRFDGKLLTKAVDIAVIAKRTHRIRGGSVQIN